MIKNDRSQDTVLLFYPPGMPYQRGEDRSQGNIKDSTSTSIRAPNDLCYAAADLKRLGFMPIVRDYQTIGATSDELFRDIKKYQPCAVFISTTNATIFSDLEYTGAIKKLFHHCMIMVKGSLFFDPDHAILEQLALRNVDYLIGMESDYVTGRLVNAHFNNSEPIDNIPGLLYKTGNSWTKTTFAEWKTDLDNFPFPDRSYINNHLYTRPDTNEAQATIVTSRGCPAQCTYCLTPRISGSRLRQRSPENILAEMMDCYTNHGIHNFFFKSDTFTFDYKWVDELCRCILRSPMKNKIQWVANSRTQPLKKETLEMMREAGCWLTAFGFESGHPDTLTKICKGTTIEDNLNAANWAKSAGLKIFGFFMIGFPWEEWKHIEATNKHISAIDSDFIEIHLAIPYYNTELYAQAVEAGTLIRTVLGGDYFNPPSIGTKFITLKELIDYRKRILLRYHMRPAYIFRKLFHNIHKPKVLYNYAKFGYRLINNSLKRT